MTPAEEHRRIAGVFTDRVRGAASSAWDRPAPVDGWVARDVVRHLVEWFPSFLEGLRKSGQYGLRVPVPDDADVQTRLLGSIGRNP